MRGMVPIVAIALLASCGNAERFVDGGLVYIAEDALLVSYDIATGDTSPLAPDAGGSVSASVDGRSIAYRSLAGELILLSGRAQVLETGECSDPVVWRPGGLVTYCSQDRYGLGTGLVTPDGVDRRIVAPAGIAVSDDAQWIAYGAASGPLVVEAPDGSQRTELTTGSFSSVEFLRSEPALLVARDIGGAFPMLEVVSLTDTDGRSLGQARRVDHTSTPAGGHDRTDDDRVLVERPLELCSLSVRSNECNLLRSLEASETVHSAAYVGAGVVYTLRRWLDPAYRERVLLWNGSETVELAQSTRDNGRCRAVVIASGRIVVHCDDVATLFTSDGAPLVSADLRWVLAIDNDDGIVGIDDKGTIAVHSPAGIEIIARSPRLLAPQPGAMFPTAAYVSPARAR